MAHCPNCGRKLHLTDWRPECPGCHVNLIYFNANDRLLSESEKAEIEHAKFQPKIDRAKAAYAGSKLAIIRIILSVLPAAGLFLPLCHIGDQKINVIDIYKYISNDTGDLVKGIFSGQPKAISAALLLVSAVMLLVCLVAIIASLGKRAKIRSIILYGIMLASACASATVFAFSSSPLGIGAFVYIALIAVLVVWNIIVFKKGIPVNYTLCLIGGIPSDEYFAMVESGMTLPQIRRKMLVALSALQQNSEEENKAEEEEAAVCQK